MSRLVYKLVGQKRSDTSALGYYAKGDMTNKMEPLAPISYSRSLPLFHRISMWNEKTKRYEPKRVAYSPYEKSIYVDEWINPNSKAIKPRFKEGILIVETRHQQALADLLDILPSNGSNPNRDEKDPIKFIQLNKGKQAEDALKQGEKVVKEILLFFELPTEKLRAIANSVGLLTNSTESVWKYKLYQWAQNHPDDFVKHSRNPELDYVDTISRAELLGIIKFESSAWSFKGNQVLKVSQIKNPYTELAGKLINEPPLERAIANEVAEKEGKSNRTIGEAMKDVNMDEINGVALIDLAMQHKVLKYNTGVGYEFIITGDKVPGGRKKEDAAEAIDADPELRSAIIKELNSI